MYSYAEIAVDSPANLHSTFSYSVPSLIKLLPGQVVLVPFGARIIPGVVIKLTEKPQVSDTRDIVCVLEDSPLLSEFQLDLALWISEYYFCSLFDCLKLMFPPGFRIKSKRVLSIINFHKICLNNFTDFQRIIINYINNRRIVSYDKLQNAFGEQVPLTVKGLINNNVIKSDYIVDSTRIKSKYIKYVRLAQNVISNYKDLLLEQIKRSPKKKVLLDALLSNTVGMILSEARKTYGSSVVNSMIAKNWLEVYSVQFVRDPLSKKSFFSESNINLTSDQKNVSLNIKNSIGNLKFKDKTFLLFGVTGSGKTEVYIDTVFNCISKGKTALILVPEISLTYQIVSRFYKKFPNKIAVLHSGLTPGQRFDQWQLIKSGRFEIVIGSRSAIFAPIPNLGLIVLDEEHEWTYKQSDMAPRYHTREVALKIAELRKATLVLGSASPSLVSYKNALDGKYKLLKMNKRVRDFKSLIKGNNKLLEKNDSMPSIEIIDMRDEIKKGNNSIFSKRLNEVFQDSLNRGDQVIFFVNRRGFSSYMQCNGCGLTVSCRRCSIALTYYRDIDRLICNYCGYKIVIPVRCSKCSRYQLNKSGFGTQAVFEYIKNNFPHISILRMDRDSTNLHNSHEKILNEFSSGDAQVLIGTQMITKGLHFPNVNLVGALSADVGLGLPDFTSNERVFQLLCQVVGRSGRGVSEGIGILQTLQPEHHSVISASSQDYESFYNIESDLRKNKFNPPFQNLIRLLFLHPNKAKCEQEAIDFTKKAKNKRDDMSLNNVVVLGPNPAYPNRVRGNYRWNVVFRGDKPRDLLKDMIIPRICSVDVDPISLL